MVTDYDGAAVFDAGGEKIGHVERTYIDDARTSRYVEIKIGTLFAKHRLVPLDGSQTQNDGLHVPLTQAEIQDSPDVSKVGDGIGADVLSQVEAYYADVARNISTTNDSGEDETTEERSDSGDGEPVASSTGPDTNSE